MTLEIYFSALLQYAEKIQAPDIHISSGSYPLLRDISGDIITLSEIQVSPEEKINFNILSSSDVENIIRILLSPDKYLDYKDHLEVDSSYSATGKIRYRVNCYTDINGKAIALRQIPTNIPSIESLGLSQAIKEMCDRQK